MYGSIIGRVGRVESKTVGDKNTFLLEMSIVEDHYDHSTRQKVGCWYKCEYWGAAAERISSMIFKGQMVTIVGQSWTETYLKDGFEKQYNKCKADHVMMQSFAGDNARSSEPVNRAPEPQRQPDQRQGEGSIYGSATQSRPPSGPPSFDDDIPF